MRRQLLPALGILVVFTIITGLAYPLVVTGIAQGLFADKANGSLVERDGQLLGSALIGQPFSAPEYFHPRPSAAGYAPGPGYSFGSNFGPTNETFLSARTIQRPPMSTSRRPMVSTTWSAPIARRTGSSLMPRSRSTPSPRRAPGSTPTSHWSTPGSRRRGSPTTAASTSIRSWSWSRRTPTAGTSASSASQGSTSCSSISPWTSSADPERDDARAVKDPGIEAVLGQARILAF